MAQDYYQMLGVSKTADDNEIKKAYRKMAHQYHPDKQGGDEVKFKEINEAYQVLSDREKRAQYDQYGSTFEQARRSGGQGNPNGGFGAGGFEDIFGGNMGGFEFRSSSGGGFEDIFGDFFGGGASGSSRSLRGQDIRTEITIDFEDAHKGLNKEISVTRDAKCDVCQGFGAKPGSETRTCSTCLGKGYIRERINTILGFISQKKECHMCGGKGKIITDKCNTCSGTGVKRKTETIRIEIPAGIDNGQTIQVEGKGFAVTGGATGDLYVTIRVRPHRYFERSGADLYYTQKIGYSEAVFGTKKDIPTLDGDVMLSIPKGTHSGEILRLRGKGIHTLYGRNRGDMYVKVMIEVPKNISRKAKKLLEQLHEEGL
jgi:molecular chaperone DnaJ